MQVTRLDIEGLLVFEPRVFEDERGAFFESFNLARFREATGLDVDFVQDNHSISHKCQRRSKTRPRAGVIVGHGLRMQETAGRA